MNEEIEPILIGDSADIEKDCVENFEYEENDYAIFHIFAYTNVEQFNQYGYISP